jgi:hypothetical protein
MSADRTRSTVASILPLALDADPWPRTTPATEDVNAMLRLPSATVQLVGGSSKIHSKRTFEYRSKSCQFFGLGIDIALCEAIVGAPNQVATHALM